MAGGQGRGACRGQGRGHSGAGGELVLRVGQGEAGASGRLAVVCVARGRELGEARRGALAAWQERVSWGKAGRAGGWACGQAKEMCWAGAPRGGGHCRPWR
jgi:hypothetical protein